MTPRNRPLSPFLQIYRLPLVAWVSITHRITGIGMAIGLFLLTWWLGAAAGGPECYATFQSVIGSFIGRLALFGFTVSLFYHLVNGVRHLLWDINIGFSVPQAQCSAKAMLATVAALTILSWIVALA